MRHALLAITATFGVGLMACGNDDGMNNNNNTATCAVEANFTSIHDNLLSKPGCASAGCHAAVSINGGLNLEAGKAEVYRQLTEDPVVNVNVAVSKRIDTTPETSFLYIRLAGTDATVGSMPPGVGESGLIPECQRTAVSAWIAAGAPND